MGPLFGPIVLDEMRNDLDDLMHNSAVDIIARITYLCDAGRFNQAECGLAIFFKPVCHEVAVVLVLKFEVFQVRFCNSLWSQLFILMTIHLDRHTSP